MVSAYPSGRYACSNGCIYIYIHYTHGTVTVYEFNKNQKDGDEVHTPSRHGSRKGDKWAAERCLNVRGQSIIRLV